tara:strand:+ start:1020 stop:1445 length:426 start_codon:yes stop_codon:yes gene_type:complete
MLRWSGLLPSLGRAGASAGIVPLVVALWGETAAEPLPEQKGRCLASACEGEALLWLAMRRKPEGKPMTTDYVKNSITLPGAMAMGTDVMIGAGIFALTGQIAELAGPLFPLSLIAGAVVTAFSAYTYAKMSNAFRQRAASG